MSYRSLLLMAFCIMFLAGFTYALPAPDEQQDLFESGYGAILNGQWWILAGVALSGLHLALRTYGPWRTWLGGGPDLSPRQRDIRGFVSVIVLGALAGLGHALLIGATPDRVMAAAVFKTVATAVFAYVGVRKVSGAGGA